jgi:hypothetical protein
MTDDADGADKAVRLGSDVELAQERTTADESDATLWIHGHPAQPRQVDDEPTVGGRVPRIAVGPGADGDLQAALAPETDRRRNVVDAGRPDEERRSTVEGRVPDATGIVVCSIPRGDDLAAERLAKATDVFARGSRERTRHDRWPSFRHLCRIIMMTLPVSLGPQFVSVAE